MSFWDIFNAKEPHHPEDDFEVTITELSVTGVKKAVLTAVRTFAEEQDQESSSWKDADFVAEMDRRMAELESGKVKGYSWDEVKQRARDSVKPKKRK